MKILFDTHTFIWAIQETSLLSAKVRKLLNNEDLFSELLLSSISLREICMLENKRRIRLAQETEIWFQTAFSHPKLRIVEISPQIALRSCALPGTFHTDPADQIIVATALCEKATILTKDRKILDYPHVKSLW